MSSVYGAGEINVPILYAFVTNYLELLHQTLSSIRSRRSVSNLLAAIEVYESEVGTISKEVFLKHLSYTCDECNGHRDLALDCTALRKDTCQNTETRFVFEITGQDGTDGTDMTDGGQVDNGNSSSVKLAYAAPLIIVLVLIIVLTV